MSKLFCKEKQIMRLEQGNKAPYFELTDITGIQVNLDEYKGQKILVSFQRFAGCPFCNLRLHQMITRFPQWQEDLAVLVIFDSTLENLQQHANEHKPPFPVLADEKNTAYQDYGVEYSWLGVLKGSICRFPTMIKALAKGYVPKSLSGKKDTMPASFLIDEDGIIQVSYYGQDEGDYIPFDIIESFIQK